MDSLNLGTLSLLGVGVLGGLLGARAVQRFRTPQVVGYILIGVLLGGTCLNLIKPTDVTELRPFNMFALGIIGFLVGGELQLDTFRKYGRQFLLILLGEGLAAFFLVGIGSALLVYNILTHGSALSHHTDVAISVAAGVVFGAIASATDPASTINVLWEYRARGVVTTSITAIVALDDALAMTLYGIGTGLAQILSQEGNGSISHELGQVAIELGGAMLLGLAFSLILWFLLRYLGEPDKALGLAMAVILLVISVSAYFNLDVILASMTLGFCLVNFAPHRSKELFEVMRGVSTPIYVMFFVLVGARLSLGHMPGWLWGIVIIYVVGRNAGKVAGAWLGARLSNADDTVRKYLGLGLFAQGGVAVGLSIMASHHLGNVNLAEGLKLGDAIIFAVTATTLIMQLTGPPMVKYAIKLARELGRNITDADIIADWNVSDVVAPNPLVLPESLPIADAIARIGETDALIFPVIDENQHLTGIVSMAGLRAVLVDKDTWSWLVVADVMEPVEHEVHPETPLKKALLDMEQMQLDQFPVVDPASRSALGVLDRTHARKRVSHEVLRRQHA